MKRILLAISIFATLIARANAGGPDAFGYTWKDSNEPGGPAYNWMEISTTGTPINGLGDDNFVGPIQIGFQFAYYWYTESKVWVGSNGYVEFGPGNIAANFPNIPNPSGVNNFIGGLMADMTFLGSTNPGRAYFMATQDSFIVEYKNVPYWDQNPPNYYIGDNTFEIILNKADSSITVNFQSCTGASISNFVSGIECNIGTMGLQPLATQPPNTNYTIKYYYPPVHPQITDAAVSWNDNDLDGGIFLANLSGPHSLTTQVENSGNQSIGPVSVNAKVTTLNNTVLTSSSYTTPGLVPSQVDIFNFPNTFSPTTNGTRKYVTTISGVTGDTIPVNDSIVQEIVVVDTTQPTIRLCYTNGHLNPILGTISWAGGQGGVGVFLQPPTYPARILNMNFVCTSAPTSGIAFYAKLYDDNGPGGSPGTLLDSIPVMGNQITVNGITVVPLNTSIIIPSGGFYVNWDMATTQVSIAEDLTPPFSRRSYETFQNIWSNFRDYTTSDFFIGADYAVSAPEDVGVSSIWSPANNATVGSGGTNVSCWIRNYGMAPDNYFITVKYKLGGSSTIVSQAFTGSPIYPGDSAFFTFGTQLVAPYAGTDVLYVWTNKSTDIDHSNDTSSVMLNLVGIEELNHLEGVSVFPVPANEKINFQFENGTDDAVVLTITDITGKVTDVIKYSQATPGATFTVDLSCYAPGTYLYSIQSGGKTGNGKFTKTR